MNTKSLSDAQLVSKYISGDENSLSVLINRHQSRLYAFIFSKIQDRDATEDVFQDTFIKVINTLKRGKYNEQGKFLPWVMRISHNLIIDYFRKNKRLPKFKNKGDFDIFSVLSDESPNAENKIVKSQITDHVRILLEELPEDQKMVIKMRIYQDMSFKEISENTNVSINTALGRMRYGLINLRKMIDNHNISLIN
ncbi:MAG: RNA polymerase subunit sigma-24 [Flavobacteriaceae bacterium]|jgi:RNA polymerase sigma-70 factor (ECF subfamily)|nr:RNA polymerase subunit sigma-24 [Flavobacteriaceae bacterium]|tara:strand:- start:37 stop:621 length:585 start_codon:yes stop_codon:yes gene_type:complete